MKTFIQTILLTGLLVSLAATTYAKPFYSVAVLSEGQIGYQVGIGYRVADYDLALDATIRSADQQESQTLTLNVNRHLLSLWKHSGLYAGLGVGTTGEQAHYRLSVGLMNSYFSAVSLDLRYQLSSTADKLRHGLVLGVRF